MKFNISTICFLLFVTKFSLAEITVIHNVQGNTINNAQRVQFEAIAFKNNTILNIGSNEEIKQSYPKAQLINGNGQSMLPGLHDAHAHIMGYSRSQSQVDLAGVTSLKESLQKIKDYATKHPNQEWIIGRGWNQVLWKGKKFPTKADLDKLEIDRPIWLRRIDGHAGWANSIAMQIAGSSGIEEDIKGGEIIVDENGVQSGVFVDNAMDLIEKNIPQESPYDTIDFMLNGLNKLAALGLTSVDDAGIVYQTYNAYKLLAKNKLMPIRINAMLASGDKSLNKMLKNPIHDENGFLQIHTIKYIFDGALGSRGAAMLNHYSDRPNTTGLIVQTEEFIKNIAYTHASDGWQTAIHAIGDAANHIAINIMSDERAFTDTNRNRIEHAQIISPEDIPKIKKHNIIASMQPTHATSDKNMAEDRIGKERLKGAYAWQTLLKQGVVIASGSDFPVELANPFYGIHAAVTRQDRDNQPDGGWIPSEKMTLEQALASFTISAAYTNRRENELGSLEKGKRADFILVDQNIFNIKPQDIWKTSVLQTWVDGKKVYHKE